jgi:DnaJ family protein C protein 27
MHVYIHMSGALLVFDVSSRASFESLDGWLQEAKRYGCVPAQSIRVKGGENTEGGNRRGSGRAGEAVMFLVGNKNDRERAVKTQEGRAFAAANGMKYFETSACSGENVTSVFEELFDDVSEHLGYRSGSSGNARSGISSAPEE